MKSYAARWKAHKKIRVIFSEEGKIQVNEQLTTSSEAV